MVSRCGEGGWARLLLLLVGRVLLLVLQVLLLGWAAAWIADPRVPRLLLLLLLLLPDYAATSTRLSQISRIVILTLLASVWSCRIVQCACMQGPGTPSTRHCGPTAAACPAHLVIQSSRRTGDG